MNIITKGQDSSNKILGEIPAMMCEISGSKGEPLRYNAFENIIIKSQGYFSLINT